MYEKNQGLQHQIKEKQIPAENTAIDNTIAMLKSQVGELHFSISSCNSFIPYQLYPKTTAITVYLFKEYKLKI